MAEAARGESGLTSVAGVREAVLAESTNPLKQILNIRRDEAPRAALMFAYFFLVITTFWILKPLKKTLFIGFYQEGGFDLMGWALSASQAEQFAKVLNMLVAFAAATLFGILARRFRRQQLTYIFSAVILAGYGLYALTVGNPGDGTVWTFYLFGDLYSTLMVATFFAFLNDSVASGEAKRLYGVIGLGGVLGGAFGSTVLAASIDALTLPQWLGVCTVAGLAIVGVAAAAAREFGPGKPQVVNDAKPAAKKASAFDGAALVFKSRYLLAVVAIVGLYEMVSTIMDFQFTQTVEHYVANEQLGSHFSLVFAITNWTAVAVQLVLTSFVMQRFGVGTALMVLPIVALAGSLGFLALPILWTGSLLNTADNGFSYSINQSAKEALYVPTSSEEKYQAKAFIDMFVQRFAKALAVGLNLMISSMFAEYEGIRWLSLITAAILVVWLLSARYAGRRFNELTQEPAAGEQRAAA